MLNYIDRASEHIQELYPYIIYAKPQLSDLPPGAILGTWTYSVPGKMRFILARDLEIAPGVMPADVSRAWVRGEYTLPLRRRKSQFEKHYPVPLHAVRGEYGDCCYIDIKGAYLRVLSMGYDVEYRRGHYIGACPQPVPIEVAANKFCYSIAVAMSGSTLSNLSIMGKEGVFNHRPFNLYSNPCLFKLAQETLNGIGSEILSVLGKHCVYMNTDGFIVSSEHAQVGLDIIASWGFDARVKSEGKTEVRGVASWRVGDRQTRRFDPKAQDFTSSLMTRDERLWLKKRWVKWSDKLNVVQSN